MRKSHLTLFLLLAVTGCGFKGPLTLPPAETKQQAPAPAAQPAGTADKAATEKAPEQK
jgi:predicted small lipoprotein YifL